MYGSVNLLFETTFFIFAYIIHIVVLNVKFSSRNCYQSMRTFVSILMTVDKTWPEKLDRIARAFTSIFFKHLRAPIIESIVDDGFATSNFTFTPSTFASSPTNLALNSSLRLWSSSLTPLSSRMYNAADWTMEFLSPYNKLK